MYSLPAAVTHMDLTRRIKVLEQKWASLGYPVDSLEEDIVEEFPQKKIRLDPDQDSANKAGSSPEYLELTSYVLEGLSNRIEALEGKWKSMFADAKGSSTAFNGNGAPEEVPVPVPMQEKECGAGGAAGNEFLLTPLELSVNEQILALLNERMAVLEKEWSNYFDEGVPVNGNLNSKTEGSNQNEFVEDIAVTGPTATNLDRFESAVFSTTYKCRMCSKMIPNFQDLRSHLETSHQLITNEVVECTTCRIIFATSDDFTDHNTEVHNSQSPLLTVHCTLCKIGPLQTRKRIGKHFRGHMLKNCDSCHQSYKQALCSQNFENFLVHLSEHIGTDTNPVFKCQIPCCRLLFKTQTEQIDHFKANHELECGLCQLKNPITMLKGLHGHLSITHGIPDASTGICPMCSEGFPDVFALMTHVLKQHEEKLTTCNLCKPGKKRLFFAPAEHLPDHIKRYHSHQKKNAQVKMEPGN